MRPENISIDGGTTFEVQTEEVIFGTYFFLDDVYLQHDMLRYTLLTLISAVGGFFSTIWGTTRIIMRNFNRDAAAEKVIKNLYYSLTESNEEKIEDRQGERKDSKMKADRSFLYKEEESQN